MKDITPDLLERIKKDFERQISSNSKISDLIGKLDKGTATYLDANEYSIEIGRTLANVLGKNISSDVLPNGKMYYNIANRIINDTLSRNHDIIADYAAKTQKALNTKAKIGLKVVKPVLNQDRIDGIVNRASSEDRFDNVKWILDEPIVNFSQSIVDDSIRENADIHYQKGLNPKIIRKESGNCCKWCRSIAGVYAYPNVPKDVYRRHQNCRCTVDYYPGDGKVQNVHTKRITKIPTSKFEELKRREKDKKLLNIREDSREYKELVNILGDKAPKSLAIFQDMKYNDIEKYEQIKDHAYIQEMFDSGKWKDKINPEKQARHMESTAPEGKSYFFDDVDVEYLYEQNKMTSTFRRRRGINEKNFELIDLDHNKEYGIDVYTKENINGFTIHYSKTGSHLIPTYNKRKE